MTKMVSALETPTCIGCFKDINTPQCDQLLGCMPDSVGRFSLIVASFLILIYHDWANLLE